MGIYQGKKLMVFIKEGTGSTATYKSIGYCTNHTLSTSASTVDVAHKDLADTTGNGHWQDQDVDTFSWTISSENFYVSDAQGLDFADIWALYAGGTTVELKFGLTANSTTGVTTGGWVPDTNDTNMLSGKAVITSLDLNAPVSNRASMSVTFTGKGPLAMA